MLQEISRTIIPIVKNEEAAISWHNSIITVHSDKTITFIEFSGDIHCLDNKIDYIASSIPASNSSPMRGMIPEQFLRPGVRNIDFVEMVLDPSLWSHNESLSTEMKTIVDMQWSPIGVINWKNSALAVLNNMGNIEIVARSRYSWKTILDLSQVIKQKFLLIGLYQTPRTLVQLKELAHALATSAMCWGPYLENNSCLFATAQRNGEISFWILSHENSAIQAEFLGDTKTDFGEIVTMRWIRKGERNFLIVCTNVFGQIFALDCSITSDPIQVQLVYSTTLWLQKDKMITKYICSNIIDDKIVLMFNKHRHLVVLVIDKESQVVSQIVKNLNDYRITDIKSNDYGHFVSTVNGKLYKIILKVSTDDLSYDLESIGISDTFSAYELYGVTFSSSNVIWALAMKERKVLDRQKSQKSITIVLVTPTNLQQSEESAILFNNMTEKLTNYWDCVELLRYRTMKTKALPEVDFEKLWLEGDCDIYKLKLYRILLALFISLEKLVRNKSRKKLPEMSLDAVREKILALHAKELVTEIYNKMNNIQAHCFKKGMSIDIIEMESYHCAKDYLFYFCEKYNRNTDEFLPTFLRKGVKSGNKLMPKIDYQIVCQGCSEQIHGFSCKNGHFNMFCSLTFTPIDGYEYLECRNCGAIARSELNSLSPLCIFCDLYLVPT